MTNHNKRIGISSSSLYLSLSIIVMLFTFIGCSSSDSGSSAPAGDTTRPTVFISDPSDGQLGVGVTEADIDVEFSEKMDVAAGTITGDANWDMTGVVPTFNAAGIVLTFGRNNPGTNLPNDTDITVTLTGFRDEAGNLLNPNPYTITFRTIP